MNKTFWGLLTSINLHECNHDILRDGEAIKRYVTELCDLIEMKRYGPCHVVNFGEAEEVAGFSMFQMIETSNISGHFVNLTNRIFIDIFSCKAYNPEIACRFTQDFFKAKEYTSNTLYRS